jgi:tetratricopeptide (TPR) repeat protein
MSPLADSLLFIGAPLVCIVTLLPLRAVWKPADISLFLLAFFTFGHHLPGFMRAYGDRELFARYRLRFLLAPLLVFLVTWWFAARDLHGLLLVVFAWDIWHVLMQHYGFIRIYDAKRGAISPVTARLDWALALAWYVTLILLSPHYSHSLLFRAYSSGLPLLRPVFFTALQVGLVCASVALTLIYLGYHFHLWRQGRGVNWRKLTMMGIFLAATYYLYVGLNDFTTGFAVWSAFHCIQYYGIVWSFNRNRVARSQAVTAFLRFLFQPRPALVALYLALILLYGGVNYAAQFIQDETWRQLLIAFVATSGTLHYYYDGFIWRIREAETGRYLGLATAARPQDQRVTARAWLDALRRFSQGRQASLMHAACFGVVLLALGALESRRPHSELSMRQTLALTTTPVGVAHFHLGEAYYQQGSFEQAINSYREAARLMPEDARAAAKLGLSLTRLGRSDEAIAEFERALASEPGLYEAHYNLGLLRARRGEREAAMRHFQQAFPAGDERALRALEAEPAAAEVLSNLGLGLMNADERAAALAMFRRAVAADPKFVSARLNLGNALLIEGDLPAAQNHFEQALAQEPSNALAHNNLGLLLLRSKRQAEAIPHLQFALQAGDAAVRASALKSLQTIAAQSSAAHSSASNPAPAN